MSTQRILVVDDEEDLLDLLRYNLEREGFEVLEARDGVEGLRRAHEEEPDLIILDIMMPRKDGIEVCQEIREDPELRLTPILMLTARTEEEDEIRGLDAGADDYIPKPVSPQLLISRTEALLRRTELQSESPDRLKVHDLVIDRDRYVVEKQTNSEVNVYELPRKEFELLYFLASSPGHVYTRTELLDNVWGPDVFVVDRTVDVHVRKIREKLGSHYIETIKGVGYRFQDEPA